VTFRDALRTRAGGAQARIIFPEGNEPRVVQAAAHLAELGIARPILLGPGQTVIAQHARLPAVAAWLRERYPARVRDGLHALDLAADPLRFAAALVALGDADGCVAGASSTTADVIRAALWAIGLAPGQPSLSAAIYLGIGDRVVTCTDISVVPHPDAAQLAASALAACSDRRTLVGDEPVVAFLSYSTAGSAGGPAVAQVREAAALFRALAPDVISDGELQVDAALDADVCRRKAPGSPVAGRANVLVFPTLDAGNIGYKLVERLAGATAAGPLLQGLALPMSDLSRGAKVDDIVDVAAMVALQARGTNA
jgi:phosphate acetyltransferase